MPATAFGNVPEQQRCRLGKVRPGARLPGCVCREFGSIGYGRRLRAASGFRLPLPVEPGDKSPVPVSLVAVRGASAAPECRFSCCGRS